MAAPLRTAIVYDFDGTLAPRNLPEHTFLPAVGIDEPEAVWRDVKREAQAHDGCEILAYMHRMLEVARAKGVAVTRQLLQDHGRSVPLFAGVEDWFEEMDSYGREKNLAIEPSMKMVRQKGGQAVAVFDPELFEQRKSQGRLERLIAEDRVDYVAAADYTSGSLLRVVVRGILGRMSLRTG